MQWQQLTDPATEGATTWALVFDIGDAVTEGLRRFAHEHDLRAAHFSGVGALSDVVLRYFDWERKAYRDIPLDEQVEVLTITGNIARESDQPRVHAHLIVGRSDGSTRGGHLKEAHVRPTLELVLTEEPHELQRRRDERTGLALLDV